MHRHSCLWFTLALVAVVGLSGVALGSDPDLVGWWGFDAGAGTSAGDASDYGNDGTLMDAPQWVEGYFLGALEFDGEDDYIEVPHDSSLCVDDGVAVMMWANLTRTDDRFTAQYSADGTTWTDFDSGDVEISMGSNVYVGLAVTSHNASQMTIANFSNVSTTGTITGQWNEQAIGVEQPSNAADSLYVTVKDSAGHAATVMHPNANATQTPGWQVWQISLADLAGVDLGSVESLCIGVGNPDNPTTGGVGTVFVDDTGYGRPAPVAETSEEATE